jgi:hypothetical protein
MVYQFSLRIIQCAEEIKSLIELKWLLARVCALATIDEQT